MPRAALTSPRREAPASFASPGLPCRTTRSYHWLVRFDKIRERVRASGPDVLEAHSPYLGMAGVVACGRMAPVRTAFWHADHVSAYVEPALGTVLPPAVARRVSAPLWQGMRALLVPFDATFVAGKVQAARLRAAGVRDVVHVPLGVDGRTFRSQGDGRGPPPGAPGRCRGGHPAHGGRRALRDREAVGRRDRRVRADPRPARGRPGPLRGRPRARVARTSSPSRRALRRVRQGPGAPRPVAGRRGPPRPRLPVRDLRPRASPRRSRAVSRSSSPTPAGRPNRTDRVVHRDLRQPRSGCVRGSHRAPPRPRPR